MTAEESISAAPAYHGRIIPVGDVVQVVLQAELQERVGRVLRRQLCRCLATAAPPLLLALL